MTINKFQERINQLFSNEDLTVLEYSNMKEKSIIKCNKCNTLYTVLHAENFLKRKVMCHNCHDTKEWIKQKKQFLIWLESHPEFELVEDLAKIHDSQAPIKCRCTLCGRIQTGKTVYNYYDGKKCYCQTKSVKKDEELLLKDFDQICIFLEPYQNTDTPILLRSLHCKHEFKCAPKDILRKPLTCPICKSSHGEKKIMLWLEKNNINYCKEYKINKQYRIDFYLPDQNIFIEYNGIQHYKPIDFFGGQEQFNKQQNRDQYIRSYCKNNNIALIEFSYLDYNNLEEKLREAIF